MRESTWAEVTYATALNRNQDLFFNHGMQRDIPRLLLAPDEEVLLVVPGTAGEYPNVMVVTDRRIMLAQVAGPVKRAKLKREIPAQQVASVSYRPGIFTRIAVHPHQGRPLRIMPHRKTNGERFVLAFEHLLRTGNLPS
ncbi:PH domain-containing protein [Saccharomonospora sp. NPDC006951]